MDWPSVEHCYTTGNIQIVLGERLHVRLFSSHSNITHNCRYMYV